MKEILYPDFEVIKENWWKWELENGSIVKTKINVISFQIESDKKSDESLIGFNMKSIVGFERITSKSKLSVPVGKSRLWKGQNDKSLKLEELDKFDSISTENNYYEIHPDPETTLLVIISLKEPRIQSSNKFLPSGDPVYIVSTQHSLTLINLSVGEEITSQLQEVDADPLLEE